VNQRRIRPPTGLSSGCGVVSSCCSGGGGGGVTATVGGGGGGLLRMALPVGGGGGDGHTSDLVSGESGPTSLASILGARVPVGQPSGSIRICVVRLYAGHGGVESGTGKTLIGLLSSSSSTTVT
jgi:hypothetical protein